MREMQYRKLLAILFGSIAYRFIDRNTENFFRNCLMSLGLIYLTISLAYMSHSRSSDFGSLDNMKNQLAAASVGVQGSGWGWLGYNKQMKKLQIATCVNQDPLQATTGTF